MKKGRRVMTPENDVDTADTLFKADIQSQLYVSLLYLNFIPHGLLYLNFSWLCLLFQILQLVYVFLTCITKKELCFYH